MANVIIRELKTKRKISEKADPKSALLPLCMAAIPICWLAYYLFSPQYSIFQSFIDIALFSTLFFCALFLLLKRFVNNGIKPDSLMSRFAIFIPHALLMAGLWHSSSVGLLDEGFSVAASLGMFMVATAIIWRKSSK